MLCIVVDFRVTLFLPSYWVLFLVRLSPNKAQIKKFTVAAHVVAICCEQHRVQVIVPSTFFNLYQFEKKNKKVKKTFGCCKFFCIAFQKCSCIGCTNELYYQCFWTAENRFEPYSERDSLVVTQGLVLQIKRLVSVMKFGKMIFAEWSA